VVPLENALAAPPVAFEPGAAPAVHRSPITIQAVLAQSLLAAGPHPATFRIDLSVRTLVDAETEQSGRHAHYGEAPAGRTVQVTRQGIE
jgi:hypothetical protein